ncbi:MAG TPA: sigma-70 family RNA polymerase sigma factor [Gemmataceae bacterium]|jgi:RNA polymerase sigma factor (TIGR02999 family)|nr:sigma-70 family RNA polymerase sigma factor [Gemmataceae bacterium]
MARHKAILAYMADVTQILNAIEAGDTQAAEQLLPLVYDELRRLAAQKLAHERPGQTLTATALVHEAYVRLVGEPNRVSDRVDGSATRSLTRRGSPEFANRRHFFAAAAEAMRRILVENARRKKRHKHGGDWQRIELTSEQPAAGGSPEELLALDDALSRLAAEDPQAAEIVQLHVFGGASIDEAAELLKLSRATAYRHWAYARAWLRCELAGGETPKPRGESSSPAG